MLRAPVILLVACAHPAAQRPIAPDRPAASAARVRTPDVVFVADLIERRVGSIYDTSEAPVRNVFLIETASARQIEPAVTRSSPLATNVFTRLAPLPTVVFT